MGVAVRYAPPTPPAGQEPQSGGAGRGPGTGRPRTAGSARTRRTDTAHGKGEGDASPRRTETAHGKGEVGCEAPPPAQCWCGIEAAVLESERQEFPGRWRAGWCHRCAGRRPLDASEEAGTPDVPDGPSPPGALPRAVWVCSCPALRMGSEAGCERCGDFSPHRHDMGPMRVATRRWTATGFSFDDQSAHLDENRRLIQHESSIATTEELWR